MFCAVFVSVTMRPAVDARKNREIGSEACRKVPDYAPSDTGVFAKVLIYIDFYKRCVPDGSHFDTFGHA